MKGPLLSALWIGLGLCLGAAPAMAQGPAARNAGGLRLAATGGRPSSAPTPRNDQPAAKEMAGRGGIAPLPPDKTTQHTVRLDGGTLSFSATAGVERLSNAENGEPVADVAYIAFVKNGADVSRRPVVFVFNGGPGYASGWLNLGGLGPWRLPMASPDDAPSAPPIAVDNQQTWLDFADLVFIDPPGTGYSRVLGGDAARKSLWSVDGDVDALATVIRRWVEQNDRMASPKYIAGESYGGFRAPKIARELAQNQGVGMNGVILISPALDMSAVLAPSNVMSYVAGLPSMTAVARETRGPIQRSDLADVEAYARGDFLRDLMKGPNDKEAVARVSAKVAAFTDLDPALVRRLGGRVSLEEFRRAFWRSRGRIASQYDGTVTGYDPNPFAPFSHAPDQLRIGLNAPITEAMVALYHQKLEWTVPNGRYLFFNELAGRQWNFGRRPEALSDLREDLALDPKFRALIEQGLTDLVTPYFRTQLEIDQIPNYGPPGRLTLKVHPGGHMLYIRDGARKLLHDEAAAMVAASGEGAGQPPAPEPIKEPARPQ